MVYGVTPGTMVNDALGDLFGAKGGGVGALVDVLSGQPMGALMNWYDRSVETAMGRGTTSMERHMLGMGIPPFGMMPGPMTAMAGMMPMAMGGYAGAGFGGIQRIDLAGPLAVDVPFLSKLIPGRRRNAAMMERMLKYNPVARAQFESMIGGRILHMGLENGKITVQRFGPGFAPVPGMHMMNPMAGTAMGYMASMQAATMGHPAMMGAGMPMFGAGSMFGNPFMGFVAGGFGNMMGGMGPQGLGGFGALPTDNTSMMGGRGFGSWNPYAQPGRINNTNPMYENMHQAQVQSLLADPSLTVEDKVVLLIMMIMNKMDKDIERQAQRINSLQQQQGNKGQTGTGGMGTSFGNPFGAGMPGLFGGATMGGIPESQESSIDVETMKLKRMIDKRSQMFDMLRMIIDKYNQTAKGIIDSMRQ